MMAVLCGALSADLQLCQKPLGHPDHHSYHRPANLLDLDSESAVAELEGAMHRAGESLGADPATPTLYPSDAAAILAALRAARQA